MRSPRSLALAAALAAGLALTGCAGESAESDRATPSSAGPSSAAPSSAQADSPTPVPTVPASSAPASVAPTPEPAPELQTITVDVAGGEATGDTGRVDIPLGTTFRLVVTADVADEIHVHGYDRYVDLEPGVPTDVEIEATIPGVFEVELHDAGTLLTRIAVS